MAGEIEVGRAAVRIIADDSQFWRTMRRLSTASAKDIKVNVEVDKDGLNNVSNLSKGLDDVDTKSKGASGGLSEFAGSIKDVRTVSATVAGLPAIIAAIGAVPAVATSAAGAVGQLGIALGQGLAGAAAIGGTALAGAVVGLKAYTFAISSTISASRTAYELLNKQRMEMLEMRRANILNTEASIAFNRALDGMITELTRTQAAIGNEVFPLFTKEIKAWNGVVEEFTPRIARMSGELVKVAAGFSSWVRGAQNGQLLNNVFNFISGSAMRAARTIDDFARAGLLVLQQLIPPATRLQQAVAGLADRFREWVQSARGAKTIEGIIALLERRFYQLVNVVRDFGLGLAGVFRALGADGGPGRLMAGLENLAAAFRETMQAGNAGFKAIVGFMRSAQPTLNQLWKLAGEAAKQFGLLASNVAKTGQAGGQMGTLASVIKGVRDALAPLRGLLEATFIAMGPVLARLIPEVSRFFQTFLGSTGPLISFLNSFERLLSAFNRLPAPVKNAIASLVALKAIMRVMGVSGLVTGMASLGVNISQTAAIAGRSGGRFAILTGALTKLRAVFATTAAFMLGPWGVAIAAVAAGAFLVYKNWGRISQAIRPALNGFKAFAAFVRPFAVQLGGAVVGALRAFASGLLSAIVPGRSFGVQVRNLTTAVGNFARRAIPPVISALKAMTAWLRKNQDEIRAVGVLVGRVIVASFRAGITVIRAMVAVLRALSNPVGQLIQAFKGLAASGRASWNALKGVVTSALNSIKRAITSGIQTAKRAVASGWTAVKQATASAWNGIKQTVTSAMSAVKNVVSKGWNQIKSTAGSVWKSIKNAIVSTWNSIKASVNSAINSMQRNLSSGWSKAKAAAAAAWKSIKSGIISAWNQIKSSVNSAINSMQSNLTSGWSKAKSAAISAWQAIKNGIVTALSNAISSIRNFIGNLKSAFSNLGLYQKGRDAIQGFINGFVSGANSLYNAARQIMGNFLTAIRNRLREGSPSREMKDRGTNAVLGFIQGLDEMGGDVEKAAGRLAERATVGVSLPLPTVGVASPGSSGMRYGDNNVHAPISIHVGASIDDAERAAMRQVQAAFSELRRQAGTSTRAYGGVV